MNTAGTIEGGGMTDRYLELGVSATKDDVHEAISELPPPAFPGAFCHTVLDVNNPEIVHAIHSDGAGTKANLAYMAYRETDDTGWFKPIAQDSVVMNLDDLLCIGATEDFLLSNTIGRNARHIPGEVLSAIVEGYRVFCEGMTTHGVNIRMGGGETADVGDIVRTLVVDSTIHVTLPRERVIDFSRVQPGDQIIGLGSFGQASYEHGPNSGIGSNGFTLARHTLLSSDYRDEFPETYAPELASGVAYRGRFRLADAAPGCDMTIAEALLSPTRSYAPIVRILLEMHRGEVHGLIHCTGGGQTKALRFGHGLEYVKTDMFELPPIFALIMQEGQLDMYNMLRTFNCGHRMEVFCEPSFTDRVVAVSSALGVPAKVVGEVRRAAGTRNRMRIDYGGTTYEFEQ